jgi:hypothetical protein
MTTNHFSSLGLSVLVGKDIFRFHWRDECQHVILDELEWRRVDARLTPDERDAAVSDLIDLVAAVDGIVQGQALRSAAHEAHHDGTDAGSNAHSPPS